VILGTANFFVPVSIVHPVWMIVFLVLTATTFCLFGFALGIWANGFEQLQFIPMLVITPLTFLGGAFYSIDMLPPAWRAFSLFNPIVYLISGFRWSFYGAEDVPVLVSLRMTLGFFFALPRVVAWIFRTGIPPQKLSYSARIPALATTLAFCAYSRCTTWAKVGHRRRRHHVVQLREALGHVGQRERGVDFGVQAPERRLGRLRRREEAEVRGVAGVRVAELAQGRHVGQRGEALRRGGGEDAEPALLQHRVDARARIGGEQLELAARGIGDDLAAAAVRHVHQVQARDAQLLHHQVAERRDARSADAQRARLRLCLRDQRCEILAGEGRRRRAGRPAHTSRSRAARRPSARRKAPCRRAAAA
jgi:hypothetical protein